MKNSLSLPRRTFTRLVAAAALGVPLMVAGSPLRAQEDLPRVVAIGGSITEIIFALDMDHLLVARDSTSSWPSDVEALPDVGYMRALSPEGVLSVRPDLIIAEEGAGPPEAIEVLTSAEIEFVEVPDAFSAAGVREKILAVALALGVPDKGVLLADAVDRAMSDAVANIAGDAPKVMFILSTQGGRIMASGTNTAANGIIELSGGVNAVTAFEGYRPLTDEAVLAAAPDVILMMDRDGDHSAANAELFALPALGLTPAAAANRVVRINGLLLLGFGPRTPEAVSLLSQALGTVKG